MALTDPVPSQATDVFRRNMGDSDSWMNQTSGTVTNRTGKTMRPLPVISDAIEQQITDLTADINAAKSDLYPIVKFRFLVDTYEITNRNELGDTATGETYRYVGATLPFNVTPATNPVGNPDFVQVIQTDHNNLTNRNAAGAHNASAIDYSESGANSVESALRDRAAYMTLAEAQAATLEVGQYVRLTDRKLGLFIVRSVGMIANGFSVIAISGGLSLEYVVESDVYVEHLGASTSIADNHPPIQHAIDYRSDAGGGSVKFLEAGTYITLDTLELKRYIHLEGNSEGTFILKTANSATFAVDCVLRGSLISQFSIKNIRLRGNRTDYASGNIVSQHGLWLKDCSYFELNGLRVMDCKRGIYLDTCYIGRMFGTVSQRCQEYGVTLKNSCTSITSINHTNFGTGGGWDISSSQYTTIICPANDHIDIGGRPDDPFLPEGSGGDHTNPSYLFNIIGSQVSIISPGMENSATQYMYCEGGNVTLENPVVFSTVGYSQDYKFIQLRGTGTNIVRASGASRMFNVTLDPSVTVDFTNSLVYVENAKDPKRQRFICDSLPDKSAVFGEYTYNNVEGNLLYDGIICSDCVEIVKLNRANMMIGAGSPFISLTGTSSIVTSTGYDKVLTVNGDGVHRIPFGNPTGVFKIRFDATIVADGNFVDLDITRLDGTIIKSYRNSGTVLQQKRDVLLLDSGDGTELFLQFTPKTANQKINFTHLQIERVD